MELSVRAPHHLASDALREYISRRFGMAFGRISREIKSIEVRLSDVNGPRGGEDKQCSAIVSAVSGVALKFEANDSDAYRAIDKLASKVKQSVFRKRKSPRQKLAA